MAIHQISLLGDHVKALHIKTESSDRDSTSHHVRSACKPGILLWLCTCTKDGGMWVLDAFVLDLIFFDCLVGENIDNEWFTKTMIENK